jgi:hypothetical protein
LDTTTRCSFSVIPHEILYDCTVKVKKNQMHSVEAELLLMTRRESEVSYERLTAGGDLESVAFFLSYGYIVASS